MTTINVTLAMGRVEKPFGRNPSMNEVTMSFPGESDVVLTKFGTEFAFDAPKPGTYTFKAVALDEDGDPMSSPVTGSIEVPEVVKEYFDAPVSLSLSLG